MAELDTMDRVGGAGRPDGQREHAAEPRHPGQAAAEGGARRGLAAGLAAGGGAAVLYTDLYTVLYTVQVARLAGRLSVALTTATNTDILVKLEGWPEVDLRSVFNNLPLSKLLVNSIFRLSSCNPGVEGPQVESLGEVIRNIASEALRCTQLDLK